MGVNFFDGGSGGTSSGSSELYVDMHTDSYILGAVELAVKSVVLTYSPKSVKTLLFIPKGGIIQELEDYSLTGNVLSWEGTFLESQLILGDKISIFYEK